MAEMDDAEHEFILNNRSADKWISEQAVKRAIARGLTPEDAELLYGYKEPTPEPTVEDLNRISKEITLGLPPARPDTPKEARARREMTAEIAEAKEQGLVITPVRE